MTVATFGEDRKTCLISTVVQNIRWRGEGHKKFVVLLCTDRVLVVLCFLIFGECVEGKGGVGG